jgi:hypothetical protein
MRISWRTTGSMPLYMNTRQAGWGKCEKQGSRGQGFKRKSLGESFIPVYLKHLSSLVRLSVSSR